MTNRAIGFDCRYIHPDSLDGIGRFTIELFRATSEKLEITAIISDPRQLEFLPSGTKYVRLNSPTSMLEPLASLRLNAHKFETVYSPMQTIGSIGKKFRLILTIHDLIYYSHPKPPNNFNPLIRLGWWLYHKSFIPQRVLLNAADEVVTISNSTKKLITENKLTKKRITVVSNAAKQLTLKPLPVEKKIVYMGSFMPYKNVEELIYGASQLNGFRLVLLSRIGQSDRLRLESLAARVGVAIDFEDGVTDEDYALHLSSATALVHASSEEGFGIPVIEAMSVGCPVVCSDIPIFKEIAGEAGLFFEVGNHKQFAQQVEYAAAHRSQMHASLKGQANLFSWEKSADALAELITGSKR